MSLKQLFSCLLLGTALVLPSYNVQAEAVIEEANIAETEQAVVIMPASANPELQKAGLLSNQAAGALPLNTLEQLGAKEIQPIFAAMPAVQQSRAARQYLRRGVLSNYDIPNAAPDFLEIRLKTMLDTGMLQEIVDIYNRTDEAARPLYQYEISFTAMAALGRISLACLEKRVNSNDEIKNSEKLKDIMLFCNKLLNADLDNSEPAKTAGGPQSPSAELSLLEAMRSPSLVAAAKAYLAEKNDDKATPLSALASLDLITAQAKNIAGLIAYPATNISSQYRALPAAHLAALLAVPPVRNEEQRFALYSAGVARGLFSLADMGKAYKTFAAERKNKQITAETPVWEKLVLLANRIQNTPSTPTQIAAMNEMLDLMPVVEAQYGLLAATPFLTEYRNLYKDMKLSQQQARYFLRMMLATNQTDEIFGSLAQTSLDLDKKPEDAFELIALWDKKLNKSENTVPEAADTTKTTETSEKTESAPALSKEQKFLTVLTAKNDADEIKKVTYEKLIALTPPADYVMPSHEVWDRTRLVSERKQSGVAVLITPLIMRDQSLAAMPVELLSLLIGTYKTVGYEQEAHQMLAEKLAGLIAELKQ